MATSYLHQLIQSSAKGHPCEHNPDLLSARMQSSLGPNIADSSFQRRNLSGTETERMLNTSQRRSGKPRNKKEEELVQGTLQRVETLECSAL
jgi:hypothetical protein